MKMMKMMKMMVMVMIKMEMTEEEDEEDYGCLYYYDEEEEDFEQIGMKMLEDEKVQGDHAEEEENDDVEDLNVDQDNEKDDKVGGGSCC